jgi:hypothetical protein
MLNPLNYIYYPLLSAISPTVLGFLEANFANDVWPHGISLLPVAPGHERLPMNKVAQPVASLAVRWRPKVVSFRVYLLVLSREWMGMGE